MLTVKLSLAQDIGEEFVNAYESAFGQWSIDGNCPYHVYMLYENDRVIGFASGFAIGIQTWYLQRAGFVKTEQKRVSNYYKASFAINEILKDWPYIMAFVSNENGEALRMVMALGFKIIGTRMDTFKNLWVEYLRVKENVNG